MKKNYLIILTFFIVLTNLQAQFIFIELVDDTVGIEVFDNNVTELYSNDEGLNTILQNHNVNGYNQLYGYLNAAMYQKTTIAFCNNCNVSQLIADLNAYNSVVEFAADMGSYGYVFPNGLTISLENNSVGTYEETNDGLVITNDAGLNQIFSDFNVRIMEYLSLYDDYELVCDCDAALLKQELDNYTNVIASTARLDGVELLSTNEYDIQETKVFPNPFKNNISIKTNSQISSVILYDILGKQVYSSNSLYEFERFSFSLKSGMYILNLTDTSQQSITRKLVKQ
ncbi:MAG: T9SS type A sorting domain-containing protein [Oceanihabitans sp.]|nr:T9SS type A sorting domain-containing protein [Oceanihabitans sp.]